MSGGVCSAESQDSGGIMKTRILFVVTAVCVAAFSSLLFADDDEKKGEGVREGLYLDTSLGASINPLGLALKADVFYRIPLIKRPGVLWRSTKIDLGVQEYLSPSF